MYLGAIYRLSAFQRNLMRSLCATACNKNLYDLVVLTSACMTISGPAFNQLPHREPD